MLPNAAAPVHPLRCPRWIHALQTPRIEGGFRPVWEDGDVNVRSRARARIAAAVDVVALVAFVLVGAAEHGEGLALQALVRTGLPLLGAWVLVASALGTYRRLGWGSLVLTWLVAVPLGLVARSAVQGGPWGRGLLVFGGVAMGFTLLFLLAGRAALVAVGACRSRRAAVRG